MDLKDMPTKIGTNSYIDDIICKINKCRPFQQKLEKLEKIDNENMCILSFHEYKNLTRYNYNINQLKMIAKHYKLKITGNKNQLNSRIYYHLYLSYFALKIQKQLRGYFQRQYNKCHGPAYLDRSLCTNKCDFYTMDDIKDIPLEQFFSYMDNDNFIYGFDILSIYNLIINNENKTVTNPYNRRIISDKVINELKKKFRLSEILKISISIVIEDNKNVHDSQTIESRALTKFLRELVDIWMYRAQLSNEVKQLICPPYGDPFRNMPSFMQFQNYTDIISIQKEVLTVLEKFVNSAIDRENKSLGAYYVLSALTLVNTNAANALPWLYESVVYF